MKTFIKQIGCFFAFIAFASPVFGATWSGGGIDNFASTPANWSGNVIPANGDSIIFDATSSKDCTWDLNQTYGSLTLQGGYTGTVTIVSALELWTPMFSAGGVPVSGYPNWEERAVQVVANAVRQAPQQYRTTYTAFTNILLPANYPAVAPLYWQEKLNRAARAHAIDMATWPCFQHDSCDGTSWIVRLKSYYPTIAFAGECIAWIAGSPKAAVDLWLCESSNPSLCAADFGGGDGHRQNIMSANFRELGNGYYSSYWVMDFAVNTPTAQPPVASATHMTINSQAVFWLNYYDTGAPQEVRVILNGSPTAMTLSIGTSNSGLYTAPATLEAGCQSYHFEAIDANGKVWRYPGTGEFRTYGINSCTEDYQ